MSRPLFWRLAALLALVFLAAGLSLGLAGSLRKKEIVFGCALALFHGFSSALFHRIAVGHSTSRFMIFGVLAPVVVLGLSAVFLVWMYSHAGFANPDVFLAIGLAGVLCLQAGEVLTLHFQKPE